MATLLVIALRDDLRKGVDLAHQAWPATNVLMRRVPDVFRRLGGSGAWRPWELLHPTAMAFMISSKLM